MQRRETKQKSYIISIDKPITPPPNRNANDHSGCTRYDLEVGLINIIMPRKNSYLTATDQFCGAGGSSSGAKAAGVEVKMALNHWELAIETHNTNHPEVDHDCTDVQACDPRRYPSTDILITSPECTNHSLAKGRKRKFQNQYEMFGKVDIKPEEERSRATMWDVPRFAEFHDYNIIIVENVVDARYWRLWDAWLMAMHSLGYKHKCCYLNSMFFHPCPQSRDRMYVVFWKKGNPSPNLDYTPTAHCPKCAKDIQAVQVWKKPDKKWGKYKQQYLYRCPNDGEIVTPYYYAAFNCIDWTMPGQRIGDRKKPLAEKTIARIEYGLEKYGDEPIVITNRYTSGMNCRVKPSISNPLPTQPGDQSHSILMPFFVNSEHAQKERSRSGADTLWTQTTAQTTGFVLPYILCGNYTPGWVKNMAQPIGVVTTSDHHSLLSVPLVIENYGKSMSKPSSAPIGAITTSTVHGVLATEKVSAFLSYYYSASKGASGIKAAINTICAREGVSLVTSKNLKIEDCHYRMLKPHEIQAAMAFADDYIVIGNSRQKTKQLGNAVTPPVMEWLVKQCVETLN